MTQVKFSLEEIRKIKEGILSFIDEKIEESEYKKTKKELNGIFKELLETFSEETVYDLEEDIVEEHLNEDLLRSVQNIQTEVDNVVKKVALFRKEYAKNCQKEYEAEVKKRLCQKEIVQYNETDPFENRTLCTIEEDGVKQDELKKELDYITEKLKRANDLIKEEVF